MPKTVIVLLSIIAVLCAIIALPNIVTMLIPPPTWEELRVRELEAMGFKCHREIGVNPAFCAPPQH